MTTTSTPRPQERTEPPYNEPPYDVPREGPGGPDSASPRGGQPRWVVVAGREMLVKVTDKNFVVTTLITLVLLAGSFGLQFFLRGMTESVSVSVAGSGAATVMDEVGRLAGQQGQPLHLSVCEAPDAAAVTAQVQAKSADVGLVHDAGSWRLVGDDAPDPGLEALVRQVVTQQALEANAAGQGTTVSALTAGSTVTVDVLHADGNKGVNYAVALVFAVLFYLASLLFGMTIATSVVEEKQSRVVEILVCAVPVRQLLLGKVVGNTALALAQMLVFVGVGLVGLSFTSYREILPAVAGASGWFLVFFLVGFVALACLWAVAGSLATRNEDLQATTPILTVVLIATMMVGIIGKGTVLTVGSYLPIVSTVAMPVRLFTGAASWWEPLVSLVITLVFAAFAIRVGARLYSRTLLQTGRKIGVREALRMSE